MDMDPDQDDEIPWVRVRFVLGGTGRLTTQRRTLIDHDIQPTKPEAQESRRIPCTIITGFLGAGKSTLLR